MNNWDQTLTSVKNWYQIITCKKNGIKTHTCEELVPNPHTCEKLVPNYRTYMKNWYFIVTDISYKTVENWNRMQNAADFGGILSM